jgi:hypothetical protein
VLGWKPCDDPAELLDRFLGKPGARDTGNAAADA